jgi:hypothetical protein
MVGKFLVCSGVLARIALVIGSRFALDMSYVGVLSSCYSTCLLAFLAAFFFFFFFGSV